MGGLSDAIGLGRAKSFLDIGVVKQPVCSCKLLGSLRHFDDKLRIQVIINPDRGAQDAMPCPGWQGELDGPIKKLFEVQGTTRGIK
jgi:hypothetical protein